MKEKEDVYQPKVIIGKFSFSGNNIYALIDPRSTHSYIYTEVVEGLSLEVVYFEENVLVTNPLHLLTTEGKEVLMLDIQVGFANRIISIVSTRKFIVKGTGTYLAYIMDSFESRKDNSQVLVVKDFLNVFPGELPRMPPDREVEFSIELEPDTTPIFCTLYKMALLELKELKVQLQDLLYRGFIRSMCDNGVHQFFLRRKKMGHFAYASIIAS